MRKTDSITGREGKVRASARALTREAPLDAASRISVCQTILAGDQTDLAPWLPEEAEELSQVEKAYRISALYMLLMPPARRRKLAAYFTPPHLCEHVLDRLEAHGWRPGKDTLLDPASGGAAFLVPAAHRIKDAISKEWPGEQPIEWLRSLLFGIEIERGLRDLSEILLRDVFRTQRDFPNTPLKVVTRGNALRSPRPECGYDAVVSNPPYGRVFRASPKLKERWSAVISEGHVNTYALFIALALEQVAYGGLVAVIVPTSFMSGPYFRALRRHMVGCAEILEINIVDKRSQVFMDVVQDTCVLIMRRIHLGQQVEQKPTAAVVASDGTVKRLGMLDVPAEGGRAWALPSQRLTDLTTLFSQAGATLADYGYKARTGYFVWNRSRELLCDRFEPEVGELPLIWARNVKLGEPVLPQARGTTDPSLVTYVKVPSTSSAVQRSPAIVLQRTTNRSQARRLVGGIVPLSVVDQYGGFVTENHTIVIAPDPSITQKISLEQLLLLLNSAGVDRVYRRLSGTVSISTRVLQILPLPDPKRLLKLLDEGVAMDDAVDAAYGEVA